MNLHLGVNLMIRDLVHRQFCSSQPTAQARPEVVCSKCGWKCAVPVMHRPGLDAVLAALFLHPLRCRSCHRKQYRFSI
jgi:hypothetical protein